MITILYVLMGQISSGKDKIINELKDKYNMNVCVSSTTRNMREGEIDNKDYHFITEEQFKNKMLNNEFLETRLYHVAGNKIWYYGLDKSSVNIHKDQLVILDAKGYRAVVEALGESLVCGLYITSSERERIIRALSREQNREDKSFYSELHRRFLDDEVVFAGVESDNKIFKINNSNGQFQNAIKQILNIIEGKYQFDDVSQYIVEDGNEIVLSNDKETSGLLHDNYENGDLVKVIKILNKKVKHLQHFIGQEGYIYFPITKHGTKRYKVLFKREGKEEQSAYFREPEIQMIKKREIEKEVIVKC